MKKWILGLSVVVGIGACGDVATTDDASDGATPDAPSAPDAEPACSAPMLACGAECIDPMTDELHCGATGDCGAGNSGEVCLGGTPCVEGACAYSPVGPQFDVPTADLAGWTPCFTDTYGDASATLVDVLAACGGADLLMGCRPTGQDTISVLAWADRASVTTDTGTDATTTTTANGTAWYFNSNHSWGFAAEGDVVNKTSCDYETTGPQRLCWHTGEGAMSSGYRCGDVVGMFDGTYERLIYTR